jgi:hypothetical protein
LSEAALDLLWALRLEDDRCWGEAAEDFQKEDALAVFSDKPPYRHFFTRPRGASKTTDVAGYALAWLTQDARPLANGHVVAANTKQAGILIEAAAGFVARTPELDGAVIVEAQRILAPNGAWVEVLAQSDSGAWGLRDAHLLILDEFAQWPSTTGARRVWTAIRTAAPKVEGCKVIILTSAGEPAHWSYTEVYDKNKDREDWHYHAVPGPVPWMPEAEVEALRWELTPSQYQRLVLNEWTQDEDNAIYEEDYDAAAQPCTAVRSRQSFHYGKEGSGFTLQPPRPGVRYIVTVDVGISQDAAVMVVAHKEPIEGNSKLSPQRVVIDHLERWKGSKKNPIQVSDIENWIVENAPQWNRAPVYADPAQFRGNIQNLVSRGVRAKEWLFTATTVGQVATALVQTFRNRQIWVPDNAILKDELLKVRLRSATAGVTRLDHASGGHDDQAVAIGMACRILLGDGGGLGHAHLEWMKRRLEEQALEPPKPVTPRSFFLGSEAPAVTAPRFCEHRWFGDGRCVKCGIVREEVLV